MASSSSAGDNPADNTCDCDVRKGPDGNQLADAPIVDAEGNPMPKFRLAVTMLIDAHGVDMSDAGDRALAALRVPSGPFRHSVDTVGGPTRIGWVTAEVPHAQVLSWRQLGSDGTPADSSD